MEWLDVTGNPPSALMSIAAILGWFGDRSSSRRAPMLLGLVATAGATLILCLGSSIGVLVAGRFLQGASEAVVWTMGLALLVDTVGQDRIGEVLGYTSLAVTLGLLSAPPLCGSLYQWGGYYAPFYLAFGVVALDIALRLIMIEKKVAVTYTQPHRKACSAYGTLRQDADFRPQNTPAMDPERSHVASTAYEPQSDQEREPLIGSPESTEPKPRLTSGTPIVLTLLTSPRMLASLWGCFVDTALAVSFDTVSCACRQQVPATYPHPSSGSSPVSQGDLQMGRESGWPDVPRSTRPEFWDTGSR